jgi:hypothetical protein
MDVSKIAPYAKAFAAFVAALGVTAAAIADGKVDGSEAVAIFSAFAGVLAVYQVKNQPVS